MDPAVRRTTEPVAKSTDPVELFRETARSELEIEHSIGNTDRTMKYDVRKTNSAVNPLVGIVWIYDGASNCVMKNTFHYNDSLAMWSRVSSENPHHDAALKRANEFIERHRREERRRLGIPDLGF
jgi:hypothetical protein